MLFLCIVYLFCILSQIQCQRITCHIWWAVRCVRVCKCACIANTVSGFDQMNEPNHWKPDVKWVSVCVFRHRRKWLIFFFHLSKLVISFEEKNQFSALRFFDFASRWCWCWCWWIYTLKNTLHHFFLLCFSLPFTSFYGRECFTISRAIIVSVLRSFYFVLCCLWYFCSFSHFWFGIECIVCVCVV